MLFIIQHFYTTLPLTRVESNLIREVETSNMARGFERNLIIYIP